MSESTLQTPSTYLHNPVSQPQRQIYLASNGAKVSAVETQDALVMDHRLDCSGGGRELLGLHPLLDDLSGDTHKTGNLTFVNQGRKKTVNWMSYDSVHSTILKFPRFFLDATEFTFFLTFFFFFYAHKEILGVGILFKLRWSKASPQTKKLTISPPVADIMCTRGACCGSGMTADSVFFNPS